MKSVLIALSLLPIVSLAAVPANYQNLTALQKQKVLWAEISKTPYATLPETKTGLGIGFILKTLNSLSSLSVSFNREADEMPVGRAKIIHPFGVTAPVEWVSEANNYTGIYQTGGLGFARLSIAGDPTLLGFVPGMALKILVKEKPSVNLQVMHSLDGQGKNTDFFATNFTNNIPKPTSLALQPLILLFSLVQNPPTYLPVNHFAGITNQGKSVEAAISPFSLVFVPSREVSGRFTKQTGIDFRDQLMTLEKGTVLYDIYALKTKTAKKTLIGHLKSTDTFVGSEYQDQKMFFQHNR